MHINLRSREDFNAQSGICDLCAGIRRSFPLCLFHLSFICMKEKENML